MTRLTPLDVVVLTVAFWLLVVWFIVRMPG